MSDLRFLSSSLLALIAMLACLTPSEASPNGAPMAACTTMTPQHNTGGQASPSIYALEVTRLSADTLSVTIVPTAGAGFLGFLIQARRDGSTTPIGTFVGPLPAGTKTLSCSGTDTSVTHSNNNYKTGVTFTWRSPGGSLAGTRFVATTCLDFVTFWIQYTSRDLGEVMGETV